MAGEVPRYDDMARCYSAQEIWARMVGNCGTTDALTMAQDAAADFRTMHDEVAEELARIQREIEQAWTGEAGEAAKKPLQTLREMSALAATNLEPSRTSFTQQSEAYLAAKGDIQPVPDGPEEAGWWGRNTWFGTSQETLNQEYDAKLQVNYEAFNKYVTATSTNSQWIPTEYPKPDLAFGDDLGGSEATRPDSRSAGTPSVGGGTSASAFGGGSGGAGYGGGSVSSTPQVNAPSGSGWSGGSSAAGAGVSGAAGATSPAGSAGATSPSGVAGPGGTGVPGVGGFGSGGEYGGYGTGSRDRRGVGGSAGAVGGFAAAGGFGPGGGFGPTGGGAGAGSAGSGGSGSGSGLGAGGRAGVGAMGSSAGGGFGGAAGPGAGRGAMGGGMMGAGGAGGRGDDDKEHQRRYIQDSDEWFRPERDEDGGILRDPLTGMPVVPPVIGE